jgi:diguanylate cyclase (GGDEF)-like protein
MEDMAHHDPLTGLPNRLLLDTLLERSIKRAHRDGRRAAVMFIDLDHFKDVNDSLGHAAGDELLRQASDRLRTQLRESDSLIRVGGDEFVAIIDDLKDTNSLPGIAGKLMESLAADFALEEGAATVGCSIGISIYPDDAGDGAGLLECADKAMYDAKQHGRNDWRFYNSTMTSSASEHLATVASLRRAIEDHTLTQVYHPLYAVESQKLIGLEALARWHDPMLGEVPPARFIPLAEKAGLVQRLDLWTIETACRRMVDWREEGIAPPRISINVSQYSLMQPDFVDDVGEVLEKTGLAPRLLEIEVRERALLEPSAERMIGSLRRLGRMGVGIAVDDFGTGYGALRYLQELRVTTLKIDSSFLRGVPGNSNDVAIARSIIAVGRALGIDLVAEGIETSEQAGFIGTQRTQGAQGFYYSQPLSQDEARQLLRRQRGDAQSSAAG